MNPQSQNKKLSAQAQKILEILSDGNFHCPIDWKYADGHGKRLTDINRYLRGLNKTLKWEWCDCGRHTAKIKMRRIADLPRQIEVKPTQDPVKSTQKLFNYTGLLSRIDH